MEPETIKISQLPALSSPTSTDVLPTVSGGTTQKVNPGQLSTDWKSIVGTITGITYNGNGSYSGTMSDDNTGSISPGMRLRSTLAAAAQVKCLLLNGTNQYAVKTSPVGMTWTDDFAGGAWVKLSSYPSATSNIISRANGTSGWQLQVFTDGTVKLVGYNGASANFSLVASRQSLPLNRWVHVSAQLDMSAFTATSTTSYVMFDGVDVPAYVQRGGTNPTALVQAGNLEVGSLNGSGFFPGKIAQVFVTSAKLTQTNAQAIYSQGITSAQITALSIASAYSFDNTFNDLNTTNANNLTAMNGASANTSDSFRGIMADGTNSTLYDYFIVMAITSSTITLQAANGCTLSTTASAISAFHYATVSKPHGFPGQRGKWIVQTVGKVNNTATSAAVNGTWYTTNYSILAPVGSFIPSWQAACFVSNSTSVPSAFGTLSTSTSSATDDELTARFLYNSTSNHSDLAYVNRIKFSGIDPVAATTYTLLLRTDQAGSPSLRADGGETPVLITLENAYL